MSSHKRIVLDFDDTLAFTSNRDWDNAKPNVALIEKCNELYNQGWTIDIYTARGSISCRSREEAADKYGPQIESWLLKNHVKYHALSFNKPLAAYYIDDKGRDMMGNVNEIYDKIDLFISQKGIQMKAKLTEYLSFRDLDDSERPLKETRSEKATMKKKKSNKRRHKRKSKQKLK